MDWTSIIVGVIGGGTLATGISLYVNRGGRKQDTLGKMLDNVREATELTDNLLAKAKHDTLTINDLRRDKDLLQQKIDKRDGVIDYQKTEIADLFSQIASLKVKVDGMVIQLNDLKAANASLVTENLQLKGKQNQDSR